MSARSRIGVAFVLLGLTLGGCAEPEPVATTLSALKAAQSDFDGRRVIVSGTLRTFDDPEHWWIENAAQDRVALEADESLAEHVGWTVEVRGTFRYDRDEGRRIRVDTLSVLR